VITATYNRPEITDAINSVLAQEFQDFEYIIIDDGSTDNTEDLVKPFLEDKRLKYVYQNNTGQAKALNNGIKIAKGKYIAFLDSDDLYLPNHLSLCTSKMEDNPKLDFLLAKFKTEVPDKKEEYFVADFFNPGKKLPLEKVKYITGIIFCKTGVLMKEKGFEDNKFLDILMVKNLQKKGYSFEKLNQISYIYRFGKSGDNLSFKNLED